MKTADIIRQQHDSYNQMTDDQRQQASDWIFGSWTGTSTNTAFDSNRILYRVMSNPYPVYSRQILYNRYA